MEPCRQYSEFRKGLSKTEGGFSKVLFICKPAGKIWQDCFLTELTEPQPPSRNATAPFDVINDTGQL